MKVSLCPDCGTKECPTVEVREDCVVIGEENNTCTLTMDEWITLKNKIKNNEI